MKITVRRILDEDKSLLHHEYENIIYCCEEIEKDCSDQLSGNSDGKVTLALHENWGDEGGDKVAINYCPMCGTKIETEITRTFVRKKKCREVVRTETVCEYKLEELKDNERTD